LKTKRSVIGLLAAAPITCHNGARYIVMNHRDQLDVLWPGKFTAEEDATPPADLMFRATQEINFGRSFPGSCLGFWDHAILPQAPSNAIFQQFGGEKPSPAYESDRSGGTHR
jgi:hypothetical protein